MSNETSNSDASLALAGQVVCAYVQNNPLQKSDLAGLFTEMHAAIRNAMNGTAAAETNATDVSKPTAAEIKKSVTREALISFIDGKPYKALRRHLSAHGMDEYAYRERYGLPRDYPMVASGYAERRSALAKKIGLGQPRTEAA